MNDRPDAPAAWKNPSFRDGPGAARAADALLLGERLRQRVEQGWAMGTFVIEVLTPATRNVLTVAGFDFAVLCMEHSTIDFGRLEHLLQAGHAAGLPMLVRTWGEDTGLIGKVLDMGAHGIMAPHVDTVERAQAVVDQARLPPRGHRGFSPLAKFDALNEPLSDLDRSTFVVVQVEGTKAIDRVDRIAAVPGIDAVFVGPYDLALSLGVPPGSEKVFETARALAESVPDGVALGIYVDDPATCDDWAKRGFAVQCVSFDSRMLANGARAVVDAARTGVPTR